MLVEFWLVPPPPNPLPHKEGGGFKTAKQSIYSPSPLVGEGAGGWGVLL